MGESFHWRTGSSWRIAKRVRCSFCETENQNFVTWMPESMSMRSKCGTWFMKVSYSSSLAKPMTRSTPARLYHERSNSTISPSVGRCST